MILILLQVTLLVILALALLAPLESLEWWSRRHPTPSLPPPAAGQAPAAGIRRFAVYLSGIAVIDGASISRREHAMLEEVRRRVPDVVITEDVFPYAMENRGLPQRAGVVQPARAFQALHGLRDDGLGQRGVSRGIHARGA